MKRGPDAILTDIGKVFAYAKDRATALGDMIEARGGQRLVVSQIFPELKDTIGGKVVQYISMDSGSLTLRMIHESVLELTGIDPASWPYAEFEKQHLSTIGFIRKVLSFYARLAKGGLPIIVVSDGDIYSRHAVAQAEKDFGFKFTEIFISTEQGGILKPQLFYLAQQYIKTRGLRPNRCIYIDDRTDLVLGAKDLRWSAIRFDGIQQPAEELCNSLCWLANRKNPRPRAICSRTGKDLKP